MMHITVLCLFLTVYPDFQSVKSDGISSKLDFGQDDRKIITIKSPDTFSNLEIQKSKGATTVVCSDIGCNKTEINSDDSVSHISDVIVHVKTSVNTPKTKNVTIDETPDVPVILGYGNSNTQFNTDNLINTNPVVVSNIDNNYPRPHHNHRKHFEPHYKQVRYDSNTLYMPYFEQSFHKHHFGEQPPLQYTWSPKGGAPSFNPVEFKGFERPALNKMQWNSRPIGSFSPQRTTTSGYTTCTCHNPGLNWYPTTPTWNIRSHSVNSHIDDKLAPLN